MELYDERVAEYGNKKANRKFMLDVLLLLRPSIIKPTSGTYKINQYGMFKNYFKVGIRNILKYKAFSFINIFGLAVAMAVSLSIILLIADQAGYDQFHQNKNNIYRVLTWRSDSGPANASSPQPLTKTAVESYPFIVNATSLLPKVGGDIIFKSQSSRKTAEVRGFFADGKVQRVKHYHSLTVLY